MKKLTLCLVMFVVLSCSKPDNDPEPTPSTYNVALTTTCPSPVRNTYCVTKSVYDAVMIEINTPSNQGCKYIEISTINDGTKKGYILSAGVGCY